jgi:aminopeptidase
MYTPSKKLLYKYADVLINFGLNHGKGIKKGETVCLQVSESARPLLLALIETVLKAGANPVVQYMLDGYDRWENVNHKFYENASIEQLQFTPQNYILGKIKDCDHFICIVSAENPKDLEGIPSEKIVARQTAYKFYWDARFAKEEAGNLSWTLALYATEGMAKETNMTLEKYWEQIINACYLNEPNPISKWKKVFGTMHEYGQKLTDLKIDTLHMTGEDIDLDVKVGENRKWLTCTGSNIPSFEIYVSPDWRGTNGKIKFNQPLYRYGTLINGVELEFKDGLIVNSKAQSNEKLLKDIISIEGSNKIGEFSLTDKHFSKITHFMAETLYDENIGGEFGNTHIALGAAFKDSFNGNISKLGPKDWKMLGFNESAVHTDIMSTTDRTVIATLSDRSKKIIYRDGQFEI